MVSQPFVKIRQFNFGYPKFYFVGSVYIDPRPHTMSKQKQKIRLLEKFRNPTERLTVTLTELKGNTKELDFPGASTSLLAGELLLLFFL